MHGHRFMSEFCPSAFKESSTSSSKLKKSGKM